MITQQDNLITAVFDGKVSESVLKYISPEKLTDQLLEHITYNRFVNESDGKLLNYLREAQLKADNTGTNIEIDEGIFAGIVGALTGATFGPKIGKALCEALGVTKGFLYDLLTSKLFTAAVCAKLGLRV